MCKVKYVSLSRAEQSRAAEGREKCVNASQVRAGKSGL